MTFLRPLEAHGSGWENIWNLGKNDLWDRGQTCPALVDAIEAHQQPGDLFHPFTADGRRRKILVPVFIIRRLRDPFPRK